MLSQGFVLGDAAPKEESFGMELRAGQANFFYEVADDRVLK